jgi:hypothetical protein
MQIMAMPQGSFETAGAISYWSLEGEAEVDALCTSLALEGVDPSLFPEGPTPAEALVRGARASCRNSHQLIRPLARGAWAFVQETVFPAASGDEPRIEHTHLLSGSVVTSEEDGQRVHRARIEIARGVERTPAIEALIDEIRAAAALQRGVLVPTDVSNWLVAIAKRLHAVGLRDRGGVYFVPRDVLPTWRRIARVLAEETRHKVFEIPAVKTEEAVEAILTAVRQQVQAQFVAADQYLSGQVSNKGLNSLERTLGETKSYVDHYVALLGAALPDLSDKLENLNGALTAARLAHMNGTDES